MAQARLHGAQGYELEALTRLAALPGASAEVQALREACKALPEGFDAALRAQAELDATKA